MAESDAPPQEGKPKKNTFLKVLSIESAVILLLIIVIVLILTYLRIPPFSQFTSYLPWGIPKDPGPFRIDPTPAKPVKRDPKISVDSENPEYSLTMRDKNGFIKLMKSIGVFDDLAQGQYVYDIQVTLSDQVQPNFQTIVNGEVLMSSDNTLSPGKYTIKIYLSPELLNNSQYSGSKGLFLQDQLVIMLTETSNTAKSKEDFEVVQRRAIELARSLRKENKEYFIVAKK